MLEKNNNITNIKLFIASNIKIISYHAFSIEMCIEHDFSYLYTLNVHKS